jgi:tetratricopeptide (TPR) repeat protein
MTPPALDFRRALLHLAVGEPELAEAAMRRATSGHEPSDESIADLGRVIAMRGDIPGAIALFGDALERHPEHWSTRETWAALLLSTGRVPEVIAACEAALQKLPPERFTREAHARTRLILARGLMAARQPNEALEQLRAAVETAPEDATIRENFAAALAQAAGDLPGAIEQLSEAVRLEPAGHMRRFQLGRLLLQTGRNDEALEQFLELRRRDPINPERDRAVASMLERVGMSEEAKQFAP